MAKGTFKRAVPFESRRWRWGGEEEFQVPPGSCCDLKQSYGMGRRIRVKPGDTAVACDTLRCSPPAIPGAFLPTEPLVPVILEGVLSGSAHSLATLALSWHEPVDHEDVSGALFSWLPGGAKCRLRLGPLHGGKEAPGGRPELF